MAGTHGHFICFFIYLCMIFVHIFFKSSRKLSTALKNTLYYSSLMKRCRAVTRKFRPKSGNTTTSDIWTSLCSMQSGPYVFDSR